MLQVIYNSHYNNGVPAMCADYFYLKLRCKHCQNPCCHNGVVDHLGPYPEYPKIFKMYPNISKSNQADLNVSECISKYPHTKLTFWSNTYIFPIRLYPKYQNVSKCFKTYPNIPKCTKLLICILSLCYSGLLGIVCWLAAERAIYDPKWLWDNEVLSSFLFQFWTLCETKNDTTTTAPQTTAAGCKLFQATVARWLGTVVP